MREDPDPSTEREPEEPAASRAELEAGLRFVHRALSEATQELAALRAEVTGLRVELAGRGVLDAAAEAARAAASVEEEALRRLRGPRLEVGEGVDKYAIPDHAPIPCAELLPLCKARCCHLRFALSYQDLDEGVLRWDLERPYRIRRREGGACHHLAGGACQVYAQRPAPCRRFDCRGDRRIWLDYERRVPAPDDRPLTVE